MELTFEKWEDGRWFVVLPDYDGDQEDLEMVDPGGVGDPDLAGNLLLGKEVAADTESAGAAGSLPSFRPAR